MKLATLESLNEQARKNAFDVEDLPWELGVDRDRFWGPETMTHLYYCSAYKLLEPEERLYYNQVHATGICEQFVFLEEILLVRGMEALLKRRGHLLSAAMRRLVPCIPLYTPPSPVSPDRRHG